VWLSNTVPPAGPEYSPSRFMKQAVPDCVSALSLTGLSPPPERPVEQNESYGTGAIFDYCFFKIVAP